MKFLPIIFSLATLLTLGALAAPVPAETQFDELEARGTWHVVLQSHLNDVGTYRNGFETDPSFQRLTSPFLSKNGRRKQAANSKSGTLAWSPMRRAPFPRRVKPRSLCLSTTGSSTPMQSKLSSYLPLPNYDPQTYSIHVDVWPMKPGTSLPGPTWAA